MYLQKKWSQAMPNILLIDNYDSFTYNLVDCLETIGCTITTVYRDLSLEAFNSKIKEILPDLILISPGYGHPSEATSVLMVIELYQSIIPILGICLGFQMIITAFGGKIKPLNCPVHGKRSSLITARHPIFSAIQLPFFVGRYHSLYAESIPADFEVIAESSDHVPMAIVNEKRRFLGLQFHPESILTEQGETLLKNSIHFLLRINYAH
jgi:anthranilate synthase component 2